MNAETERLKLVTRRQFFSRTARGLVGLGVHRSDEEMRQPGKYHCEDRQDDEHLGQREAVLLVPEPT